MIGSFKQSERKNSRSERNGRKASQYIYAVEVLQEGRASSKGRRIGNGERDKLMSFFAKKVRDQECIKMGQDGTTR
jgi:hypothetical protein